MAHLGCACGPTHGVDRALLEAARAGDRVIVVSAASDEDKTFRTGLTGDITPIVTLPVHTYRSIA